MLKFIRLPKVEPIPISDISEETIWIQKPGIKEMRYIDVYESDLDIFLENGWEVWINE